MCVTAVVTKFLNNNIGGSSINGIEIKISAQFVECDHNQLERCCQNSEVEGH